MKERSPKTLNKLNLLIHPAYQGPATMSCYPDYREVVSNEYEMARRHFLPQGPNELLLIMPNLRTTETFIQFAKNLKERKKIASSPPINSWLDVYKGLKRSSYLPDNVRLCPDIVKQTDPSALGLIDRLSHLNVVVNGQTEITLGGEFADLCVESAARRILFLPAVNQVRIDRNVSIYSPDQIPHTQFEGFEFSGYGRYVSWKKATAWPTA